MDKLVETCQRLLRDAKKKIEKEQTDAPKKTGEGTLDPEEPSEEAVKSSLVSWLVGLDFFTVGLCFRPCLLFSVVCLSPLVGS